MQDNFSAWVNQGLIISLSISLSVSLSLCLSLSVSLSVSLSLSHNSSFHKSKEHVSTSLPFSLPDIFYKSRKKGIALGILRLHTEGPSPTILSMTDAHTERRELACTCSHSLL
ncbi:mCG148488 [Mus musculus]|nr:mCG148488 [Mus musculus]